MHNKRETLCLFFLLFSFCLCQHVYRLPSLPYDYDALEPYIDQETMKIHHTRHHQAYIDNLNKALSSLYEKYGEQRSVEELLGNLDSIPDLTLRKAIQNHGGGHVNHAHFWETLHAASSTKPDENRPSGQLLQAIIATFGSFDSFIEKFDQISASVFGSGWAWLYIEQGKLQLSGFANQDSPLMQGSLPILGLDVWEHAYYLKYQNKRLEYIKSWWFVVNWPRVEKIYEASILKNLPQKEEL